MPAPQEPTRNAAGEQATTPPATDRGAAVPRHIGIAVDGNRRWAKSRGMSTADGHRAGAANVPPFLDWCAQAGVEVVTTWLASTDNLARRSPAELEHLLPIIDGLIEELGRAGRWRIRGLGDLSLVPASTAAALREAQARTTHVEGLTVNMGVGYGGRSEVVHAVRELLAEQEAAGRSLADAAAAVTAEGIGAHLYTAEQPEPDLVIRTSGEQRLGGFLMWQSVHSEFYFTQTLWPDFSRSDFDAALANFAARERRYGA